jgi:hypothetical protein
MGTEFLEKYLEQGFSRIAVVNRGFYQSASSHVETTDETIVARKGSNFVRVNLSEHIEFVKKGSRSGPSLTEEEISESEYLKLPGKRSSTPQLQLQLCKHVVKAPCGANNFTKNLCRQRPLAQNAMKGWLTGKDLTDNFGAAAAIRSVTAPSIFLPNRGGDTTHTVQPVQSS